MSTATRANTCPTPGCDEAKAPRKYLCTGCWVTLPAATRTALNKHDGSAMRRLSDLLDALRQDVPLHQIEVSR